MEEAGAEADGRRHAETATDGGAQVREKPLAARRAFDVGGDGDVIRRACRTEMGQEPSREVRGRDRNGVGHGGLPAAGRVFAE